MTDLPFTIGEPDAKNIQDALNQTSDVLVLHQFYLLCEGKRR
jgi:hypothetical protein